MVTKVIEKNDLALNLTATRKAKGLSVLGLSKLAGVARQTLVDAESGSRLPRHESLQRLATALGTTPEDLISGDVRISSEASKNKRQARLRESLDRANLLTDEGRHVLDSTEADRDAIRRQAYRAWRSFVEVCLNSSARAEAFTELERRARGGAELGPRDVIAVMAEMIDELENLTLGIHIQKVLESGDSE